MFDYNVDEIRNDGFDRIFVVWRGQGQLKFVLGRYSVNVVYLVVFGRSGEICKGIIKVQESWYGC